MSFKGRGFMAPGVPVYAHYVFAGKVRGVGPARSPDGPCGTFNVKRKQFPFKRAAPGRLDDPVRSARALRPEGRGAVRLTIRVRTTTKQGS